MATEFCGCQTCKTERKPRPGGPIQLVHDDYCVLWDSNAEDDFIRCDCYWENCLSITHKPWCAVLAGDWATGCNCVGAWRLEARMKGYAEITWPIEGDAVLEKAQNVTINGYNLKLPNETRVAEEYDLFTQDGVPVAHLGLRDGRFVAATPDRFGMPVYNVRIEGKGERGPSIFEATDRRRYLTEAVAFIDGEIRKAAIVAKLTRV